MANIGSFKKVGSEFQGEIVTLSLQTKGVRIVARDQPLQRQRPQPPGLCGPGRDRGRLVEALRTRAATTSRSSSTIRASTRRSSPTSSTTRTAKATPSSGRAPASATATEPDSPPRPARSPGRGFRATINTSGRAGHPRISPTHSCVRRTLVRTPNGPVRESVGAANGRRPSVDRPIRGSQGGCSTTKRLL